MSGFLFVVVLGFGVVVVVLVLACVEVSEDGDAFLGLYFLVVHELAMIQRDQW